MVTIGFIVEGDSEAILLKDDSFIKFLETLEIKCEKELVINAGGKNNLYHPHADFIIIQRKVKAWIEILYEKGASIIFFLLDFDNSEACFKQFKYRVYHYANNKIIIAKQALEAWYLADSKALSIYLQQNIPPIVEPESFASPFEEIKKLRLKYKGRGIDDKKLLTKDMIKSGFTLSNAAEHKLCLSAQYFIDKLTALYLKK